jgi:hypothetical protein
MLPPLTAHDFPEKRRPFFPIVLRAFSDPIGSDRRLSLFASSQFLSLNPVSIPAFARTGFDRKLLWENAIQSDGNRPT